MASSKSDIRRPLCCAADDDPFPLPDYLAPIADRPPVDIQKFIDTPMPSPPTIPPPTIPTPAKDEQQEQQEQAPAPPSTSEHLPRTAIVAALQTPPRLSPPDPVRPPTLSALLQHLPPDSDPSRPDPRLTLEHNSTVVNLAIYNSQSPTKSAQLSLPAATPLMTLINQIPCTARPNLSNSPSSALLYVGNTLYQYTLPRPTNYATPIQAFIRKYSSSKPPDILPITPTAPTIQQLTLTLGLPYPLLHHADCEHLIIFTDIFHSHQQHPTPAIHHRPPRLTPCDVCRRRAADRFTVADPLADASPFHYCGNCFRTAHYSQQGEIFDRAADFRLYSHHSPI